MDRSSSTFVDIPRYLRHYTISGMTRVDESLDRVGGITLSVVKEAFWELECDLD